MTVPTDAVNLAAASATGQTLLSLFPGVDAGLVIGAFAGAVFSFVVSTEAAYWKRALLLIFAFIAGVYGGEAMSVFITEILTRRVVVIKPPLGAMVSAALSVAIFSTALDYVRNPGKLLEFIASFRNYRGGR